MRTRLEVRRRQKRPENAPFTFDILSRASKIVLMMTTRNTKRVELLKSLRFGVELEIVGIDARTAVSAIQSVLGTTSVESFGATATMSDGRTWKAVYDASVRDYSTGRSCEVVSPILTWSDMDTLQNIVRALRAAGGRVNDTCGMHVHVDGAAFKAEPAKVRNLMALAYRWEPVAVNIARVLQNRATYCATLDTALVDRFRALRPRSLDAVAGAWYGQGQTQGSGHYDSSRYRWINVHALFDKGTIEFRLFNGTLHAGHVKANVLFALGMAAFALFSRSASFKGQAGEGSRTQPDGRRLALSNNDRRLFIVHVLCLVGEEFKPYRKHMIKFIGGEA